MEAVDGGLNLIRRYFTTKVDQLGNEVTELTNFEGRDKAAGGEIMLEDVGDLLGIPGVISKYYAATDIDPG